MEAIIPQWVISFLWAITPGIVTGIFLAVFNRKQNKKDKADTEKENNEKRKDALVISLLVATAELSYATTMAIKRGSPNGEVEVAVKRYNKAMDKFREFEREQLYQID
jgi:hypothetical protein